ncbi:MAG TPA: FAD binding domain-containing protein [Actinocrinis sp.]|jgi:carbon-monoxide dehydrogenase medium subunit|uniref:FAD binding domain-containing protein n=1 Tax=Actinocrinis sp. TaxID=1920516 RepID=UPI002DDC9D43|nr:FAD binding domain-containing protein [Actinocrinis sp.]HEV3173324.1 FAD binding domain-containing protein [Actinocrinis sp.]
MRPAPFRYSRPETVGEAAAALREYGGAARCLAGGQSLLALMNRRAVRPDVLVDLHRLSVLRHVTRDGRALRIGALARHVDLERLRDPAVVGGYGVLPEAASLIGRLPVRTMGTFGGSLAHADPSAEWCLLAVLLDAEIAVLDADGGRVVAAQDFFAGAHRTVLRPDELVIEARLPAPAPTAALVEFAEQPGHLPLVAVAAAVERGPDGRIASARVAAGGVADRPVRLRGAETALLGEIPDEKLLARVGAVAVAGLEPPGDVRADGAYRRELAAALTVRAVRASLSRGE